MFLDGLQDAYEGHLMGVYAQHVADRLKFTREQMDEWAVTTWANGCYVWPVEYGLNTQYIQPNWYCDLVLIGFEPVKVLVISGEVGAGISLIFSDKNGGIAFFALHKSTKLNFFRVTYQ